MLLESYGILLEMYGVFKVPTDILLIEFCDHRRIIGRLEKAPCFMLKEKKIRRILVVTILMGTKKEHITSRNREDDYYKILFLLCVHT